MRNYAFSVSCARERELLFKTRKYYTLFTRKKIILYQESFDDTRACRYRFKAPLFGYLDVDFLQKRCSRVVNGKKWHCKEQPISSRKLS